MVKTFMISPPYINSDPNISKYLPSGKYAEDNEDINKVKEGITSPGFLVNSACSGLDFVNTNQENFTSNKSITSSSLVTYILIVVNILIIIYLLLQNL